MLISPSLSVFADSVPSAEAIQAERIRRATEDSLKDGVEKVRKRCKRLKDFVREAWPILEPGNPYVGGWHIDLICAHLEAVTFGTFLKMGLSNRLLINIPTGMMKSLLISVLWPAWEWGPCDMAHLRYLSTSFSDANVIRDSRKMRDLVESDWYQKLWPEVTLTRRGENDFENIKRGNRQGRPFPSLTGGRGDRLLIDDPHSTETAESDADRAHAIRIFRESGTTRINDAKTSAIILIMQRLHEHDCSGVAIALNLGYIHIMLPMEFEPSRRFISPLGEKYSDPRTEDGELIFEARFPADTVERDKTAMGSFAVAGQFQQRPAPRGGLMFQRSWWEVVEAAPAGNRTVRGWDLAGTEAKKKGPNATLTGGPAWTAGVKLSRDRHGVFYIEHIARDRKSGNGVKEMIKNTAIQDGKRVEQDLPQDPGQAGKAQATDMVSMLAGYLAYASVETGDKITRARPVAAQAEAGNIKVVAGPWNEAFFAESDLFPAGAYKDQIDALSRAFARFVKVKSHIAVVPGVQTTNRGAYGDNPDAH